jgi:hypothetical protein
LTRQLSAYASLITSAHAQNVFPDKLARRTVERRAVEAVNRGMSAVNYDLTLQEMLNKTAGKINRVAHSNRDTTTSRLILFFRYASRNAA